MASRVQKEYENLLELEKRLTDIAKNEFLTFVKKCNSYVQSEDLKDEFEKNIKLLKNLKEVEKKKAS